MQPLNCQTAVDYILALLENPDLTSETLALTFHHMAECPDCRNRISYLIQALDTNEEDRLTCQECEASMPEYIEAKRAGQAGGARWQQVNLHLLTCPHCAALAATLAEMMASAFDVQEVEPLEFPTPALSFLRQDKPVAPPSSGQPWRLDEMGRLLITFSQAALARWQLPDRPQALAGVKSASEQMTRPLYQFSLQEELDDLEITLTIDQSQAAQDTCAITANIDIPSRGGWPHLSGIVVRLKRKQAELDVQQTNAFGQAIFQGLMIEELPQLQVEIEPWT